MSFSNFSAKIYLTLKRLDYGRRNMASDEINWFNPANTWDESGYEMIGVLLANPKDISQAATSFIQGRTWS